MSIKPKLTPKEQVKHLKDKGVKFNLYSETDAINYLTNNTYYFKLASYRKNFPKHSSGNDKDKYIDLDFGQLRDLAIIDMRLRYILVQMAMDIEHYIKLEILHFLETTNEDGYSVCQDFVNSLSKDQNEILSSEIERMKDSEYGKDIAAHYDLSSMPVWVFLELIPFGRLISFYKFCANRFSDTKMKRKYYMLLSCRQVRNAAAHSSCILNDLNLNTRTNQPCYEIIQAISKIKTITKGSRNKRLSNERILQIVTMLYAYTIIVSSPGVMSKTCDLLQGLKERMNRNINYYPPDSLSHKNIEFITLILDNWYNLV